MRKEIYGVGFEFHPRKAVTLADATRCLGTPWGHYDSINDAYDRPSACKVAIWEDWRCWFHRECIMGEGVADAKMWISSRNCFMFTITAYIVYNDGSGYVFYITRDHNHAYPLAQ